MRPSRSIFARLFFVIGMGSLASTTAAKAETSSWQAPSPGIQTRIWPNGVPDMEGLPPANERAVTAKNLVGGRTWTFVLDVTEPTITLFPAKGENTGVAMIVFPGGGFQGLAIDLEGTELCDSMASKGITCAVLKYRVPKTAHYWDKDCRCHVTPKIPRALQDAQRSIRLLRARSEELQIDPKKIGVIGMSAGGYLVAQTSNIFDPVYQPVDEIDKISSRPDFAVALYPGHLCRSGATLDPGLRVTKNTPPTFLLQAWDDPVDKVCHSTVYARALDDARVPAEVHLFAKGGHAFGLRPNGHPISAWPALVENWLREMGIL